MTMHVQSMLKRVFGFEAFRPFQREIIDDVLAKRDVLEKMVPGIKYVGIKYVKWAGKIRTGFRRDMLLKFA